MDENPVEGYVFTTVSNDEMLSSRSGQVVTIEGRAPANEEELQDIGAAFWVRFEDGFTTSAYSFELNPWFKVEGRDE